MRPKCTSSILIRDPLDENRDLPLNQLALADIKTPIVCWDSILVKVPASDLVWAKHHKFGRTCGRIREDYHLFVVDWRKEIYREVEFFCLPKKGVRDVSNIEKVHIKDIEIYNSEEKYFFALKKVFQTKYYKTLFDGKNFHFRN
jgi:hypothetical protein